MSFLIGIDIGPKFQAFVDAKKFDFEKFDVCKVSLFVIKQYSRLYKE